MGDVMPNTTGTVYRMTKILESNKRFVASTISYLFGAIGA